MSCEGVACFAPVLDRFTWERRSCCLWYQTERAALCEDCSLRPAAEHQARYEAPLAEAVGA